MIQKHIILIDLENISSEENLKKYFYTIYQQYPKDIFEVYFYNKNVSIEKEISIKLIFKNWLKNDFLNSYNDGSKNSTDMVMAISLLEKRNTKDTFHIISRDRDFDPIIKIFTENNIPINRITDDFINLSDSFKELAIDFFNNQKISIPLQQLTASSKNRIANYFANLSDSVELNIFVKLILNIDVLINEKIELTEEEQSVLSQLMLYYSFFRDNFKEQALALEEKIILTNVIQNKPYLTSLPFSQRENELSSLIDKNSLFYVSPLRKKAVLKEINISFNTESTLHFDNISVVKEPVEMKKSSFEKRGGKEKKLLEKLENVKSKFSLIQKKVKKHGR